MNQAHVLCISIALGVTFGCDGARTDGAATTRGAAASGGAGTTTPATSTGASNTGTAGGDTTGIAPGTGMTGTAGSGVVAPGLASSGGR